MESSEGSSEVSDADSEKSDLSHVSISTRKAFITESDMAMKKTRALARFLRERLLLPPDPEDPTKDFTDTTSGIEYPLYYFAFIGCMHIRSQRKSYIDIFKSRTIASTRSAAPGLLSVQRVGIGSKATTWAISVRSETDSSTWCFYRPTYHGFGIIRVQQ